MKKILMTSLALLVSLALFTTIAYAWISLATINVIEDLSLHATSGNKLEISLNGIDYYENIPSGVVMNEIGAIRFRDVTSNDGINFFKHYKEYKEAIPNKDYLTLDFHFRTTSIYTEVHLANNQTNVLDYENPETTNTYITSKGVLWESPITFMYDENSYVYEGEVQTYYAKDATRVAFVNRSQADQSSKIFDLSGNEQRGFGAPFGALDFLNRIKDEENVPPEAPETIYELSTFSEKDPVALTNNSKIITLEKSDELNGYNQPYYKGTVTMNVWLEGWDADALDAVFSDRIKMQFRFKAVLPKGVLDG